MPSVEKIIQKMRNQPNGISLQEAARVLESGGYHFSRQRGSHCHYINDSGDVITVAANTPAIKKAYAAAILERIEKNP
jgi:predicted RNA binding protein YcfA (HicA-like mRNA interferase family)